MRLQHALILAALAPTALSAQQARPWQSTDYYRLTVVSDPELAPDGKRVAFVGAVIRMGSDPGGTYFGALTADGEQFVTHFDVPDQDALKPKFPGGEIKPFVTSSAFRFSCVNEGYIDAPVLPGLKLAHCRLAD